MKIRYAPVYMEYSDSCRVWLSSDITAPDGFVCIEGWVGKGVCNMKVLILSCNTGEGHNSCAKALTESFRKKGITCDVTDSVRFISPVISTLMAKSHVFIYRYLPALFIHGTDDHFVPIEMTYKTYKACASEKRPLVVPGAEHAMSDIVDKTGYEDAILKFWQDFDKNFVNPYFI